MKSEESQPKPSAPPVFNNDDNGEATWAPEISLVQDKNTYKAFIVTQSQMTNELSEQLKAVTPDHDAPLVLATTANTFNLPNSIGNLQSRETKTLQFVIQYEERPEPTGILLKFQYQKFSSGTADERFEKSLRFDKN